MSDLSLGNHPNRNGIVRMFLDEDERTVGRIVLVMIDRQWLGRPNLDLGNVIHFQRTCTFDLVERSRILNEIDR